MTDPKLGVVTAEDIRTAMDRLWDAPRRVCTHISPPAPEGFAWRLGYDAAKAVRVTGCAALCGAVLGLVPAGG